MAKVRVGDNCMIDPNVGLYTTVHSIETKDRNKSGYAIPITIGNDVWIGGSCVILPGSQSVIIQLLPLVPLLPKMFLLIQSSQETQQGY